MGGDTPRSSSSFSSSKSSDLNFSLGVECEDNGSEADKDPSDPSDLFLAGFAFLLLALNEE